MSDGGKKVWYAISILGITWCIVSNFTAMLILVQGWLAPSHAVLVLVNSAGEMWYEVPMVLVGLVAWALWFFRYRIFDVGGE